MRIATSNDIERIAVMGLGLDADVVDLTSTEALTALLRRCAAFQCPCSPSKLGSTSISLLAGIRDDQEVRNSISDVLDQLISYGDLVESREFAGHSNARLLYIAPPSFVEVSPHRFLIIGIAPDDRQVVPSDIERFLEYSGHARILKAEERREIRAKLLSAGLFETRVEEWMRSPKVTIPSAHVQHYSSALTSSQTPGHIDELLLMIPDTPVKYYRGRWQQRKRQTGRFVARRPQQYGAALWSYVELKDGELVHLLDFPSSEAKWRACDEAWHLQQAIDSLRGCPQLYRVTKNQKQGHAVIDLFSPIPSWAQRRWDYVGERVQGLSSLLSYKFELKAVSAELQFVKEHMWLEEAE